ncbi:MAG: hypothetical protein JRD89_16955 [Deltaproteobacteria bacterium]|nr:hypothetical protein [Deltaproteobacteria bacterium]
MKLEEAENIANEIVTKLRPYVSRILVAGSIRRGRPFPRDIDLVVTPSDPWRLEEALRSLGQRVLWGPQLKRLVYKGVQVDIYITSVRKWGIISLVRTGSERHNIKLAKRAKELGLKFSAADGIIDRGLVVACETEEDIFKALGLEYIPPERRE